MAPKPARPRWFDLDDGNLMADLFDRPRLIHWVARTRDLEFAVEQAGYDPGPILPFSRGDYRWRITVPDDGKRPGRGVLPTLIQWESRASGRCAARFAACRSRSSPRRIPSRQSCARRWSGSA